MSYYNANRVSGDEVFKINWSKLSAVRDLATKMGSGFSVVMYEGRENYNIMHTANEQVRIKEGHKFTVMHRT